jgi:hypothetical protein
MIPTSSQSDKCFHTSSVKETSYFVELWQTKDRADKYIGKSMKHHEVHTIE